jgi:hypothetical protein
LGKNLCPHCGAKISTWKKWQLTDNRYGRKCPDCGSIIILPKNFVRFILFFNIACAAGVVLLTRDLGDSRILMLLIGAGGLILLNILLIQLIGIKKGEE